MTVRITLEALAVSVGKVQLWEGGPYWADRNIGADAPWDYGLYFWWGDTTGHRPSADGTFSFSFDSSNCPTYLKYIAMLRSEGWIVSKGGTYVLAPAHDAAHVKWGGSWRMPTYQELYELCYDKCDWTRTTQNGVSGYIVRGRGAYASNSIFLPCAGSGDRTSLLYSGSGGSFGSYWSSRPCSLSGDPGRTDAGLCSFNSSGHGSGQSLRYYGLSIRPVQ